MIQGEIERKKVKVKYPFTAKQIFEGNKLIALSDYSHPGMRVSIKKELEDGVSEKNIYSNFLYHCDAGWSIPVLQKISHSAEHARIEVTGGDNVLVNVGTVVCYGKVIEYVVFDAIVKYLTKISQ